MKNLVAVIPVRKGSQRVIDKNFRPFAGSSLLDIKLDIIEKLPVDEIIINTDSEYAIEMAQKRGHAWHRRADFFASSKATNSEYHEYLARVTMSENILVAQVTSPLVKLESYLRAIERFNNSDHNSLMSVQTFRQHLWYNGEPVNFDKENQPNSQDLPRYEIPTYGIVIAKRAAMLKSSNFICSRPDFMEISESESIDIDTPLDFDIAEMLYKKLGYAHNK
jgi:CMP-N-acetylneuraminic acid synthetase